MKQLNSGEKKVFKSTWTGIVVTAECYDEDTPYITLTDKFGAEIVLTDCDAKELIINIQKAIKILPSSK